MLVLSMASPYRNQVPTISLEHLDYLIHLEWHQAPPTRTRRTARQQSDESSHTLPSLTATAMLEEPTDISGVLAGRSP
jgi:hypothetical protein